MVNMENLEELLNSSLEQEANFCGYTHLPPFSTDPFPTEK